MTTSDDRHLALFPTCVIEMLAPDVGAAVIRVLRERGYEVNIPDNATCCGQPAWNSGFFEESAQVAATTLRALAADGSKVVVPAGSCATMIRVYWPELFRTTGHADLSTAAEELGPRVYEFTEFLALDEGSSGGETDPVAYHHSCHMLRELHIEEQPLELLAAADVEVVDWEAAQRCCGFGGLFSVKQPEISTAMADDKLDSLVDTDAEVLVGADLSCLLHLEGRLRALDVDLPVRHIAEVLDPRPRDG